VKKFIPVNKPLIEFNDIRAVNMSLKNSWISSEGPDVVKFEKKFSKYIGHKYCVAV